MTVSLWLDTPPTGHPPLARSERCDVLVIGGGMTGTRAAFEAASRGARTVLLERGAIAGGASGRNVGYLLAGPEAYYLDSVEMHGREKARELWRLNRANRDGVTAFAERHGIPCDLEWTGSALAAVSVAELATLEESARLLREDGFPGRVLDAKETEAVTHGLGFLGGFHVDDDAQVNPVKFVRGTARAAAAAGALVHEGSPVASLTREERGWSARLESGLTVRAPRVICGLNAYAPGLVEFARARVFPVRGQVFATAPSAGGPPLPVYADHGYLYVRSYQGRAVAGGMRYVARAEEVGYDDAANADVQEAIARETARHWPRVASAPVTHRWSGTMGFSRDGLPWIGEVPGLPGLSAFFGCTGHGWGYGPWAGEMLARAALGERVEVPDWVRMDRPLAPARLVL